MRNFSLLRAIARDPEQSRTFRALMLRNASITAARFLSMCETRGILLRNRAQSYVILLDPARSGEIQRNSSKLHDTPHDPAQTRTIPHEPAHSRAMPRDPAHSRAFPRIPARYRGMPRDAARSRAIPRDSAISRKFRVLMLRNAPQCSAMLQSLRQVTSSM